MEITVYTSLLRDSLEPHLQHRARPILSLKIPHHAESLLLVVAFPTNKPIYTDN